MNDLNEKLAELRGIPHLIDKDLQVWWYRPELDTDEDTDHREPWNPTADLNQLRMCWKMLTQEQKATYKQLIVDHDVQSVFDVPYQHAELILKAKEVSL